MSDKTCEERISEELDRELSRIRMVLNEEEMPYDACCEDCEHEWVAADEDEDCPKCDSDNVEYLQQEPEETREEYEEGILEITPEIVFKVGLSWGGPADGFNIYVDPQDGEINRIEYYFRDWFDGATRRLTGDDFDTVAKMFWFLSDEWKMYARFE